MLLYLIIPFYMFFAQKGYKSIYSFFRKRFAYSPWASFKATYRNHYLFGQMLLDKFAIFASKQNLFEFEMEGEEHYLQAIKRPEGILFASAHFGNFEMAGYCLQANRPINSVVYGGETAVIQMNRANAFQKHTIKLIPLSADLSHIFDLSKAAEKGEIISILCDRYITGNKNVQINFLGANAEFPLGAFHLAHRYQLQVLSIFVVKEKDRKYKVIISPIKGETPEAMARFFATSLEKTVQIYPHQWFNFYDFFNEQK